MKDEDYPWVYAAANLESANVQVQLLASHVASSACLAAGAGLSLIKTQTVSSAIAGFVFFLISLALMIFVKTSKLREKWYEFRSTAESVKTMTWKFMMKADPFKGSSIDDDIAVFLKTLENIDATSGNKPRVYKHLHADLVTSCMKSSWSLPFVDAKALYEKERVDDQLNWYRTKAAYNAQHSTWCFIILIALYVCVFLLYILRIAVPDIWFFPISVVSVLIGSLLGWTQLKKFDELRRSYSMAALEISMIKEKLALVKSPDDLPGFVNDAENAFSREHTQWVARRDH